MIWCSASRRSPRSIRVSALTHRARRVVVVAAPRVKGSQFLDALEGVVLLACYLVRAQSRPESAVAEHGVSFGGGLVAVSRDLRSSAVRRGPDFLGDSVPVHISLRPVLLHTHEVIGSSPIAPTTPNHLFIENMRVDRHHMGTSWIDQVSVWWRFRDIA
jgi:hypothetical protein